MAGILLELTALSHVPIGAYLVYRCVNALRMLENRNARFGLECVMTVSTIVLALRLSDYTVPISADVRAVTSQVVMALVMLAFLPLVDALARSDENERE